jgi:hypothetical protein
LNNLSPDELIARVALMENGVETLISIKPWRSQPSSIQQKSDLFYQIHLVPNKAAAR